MRFAIAVVSALAWLAAPASAEKAGKDNAIKILLDCGPETIAAAVVCLDKAMTPGNKAALMSDHPEDIRHGLGNVIRIGWGLSGDGPLSASMTSLGVKDADAKAEVILDGYTAHIRGERFDLAQVAQTYANRGERQNSGDVK